MADESGKVSITIPKINVWMIFCIVLLIVLAVFIFYPSIILGLTGKFVQTGGNFLTADEAANKATKWISDYFKAQDSNISVKLVNSSETGSGIYQFTIKLSSSQGDDILTYYVSKDGKLFLPQIIDISQEINTSSNEQPSGEIPKTDKPAVELFVMGFCPYGVQAETIMKPVVDLLGSKADIKIRFITSISGTTIDSIQSLHGTTEAQEDLRQACIMKYYNQKTYWTYLMEIDNNCYGKISTTDASALETCWKSAATKAGIDTAKISTCSNSTEGFNLLKADEQLANQYSVSGSPTLIINGQVYSGSRTSQAFKEAICSAFNTQPSECSQTLSASSNSTTTGGCG